MKIKKKKSLLCLCERVELINNRVNPVVISPGQTRCSWLWLHMISNDFTLKTSRTKSSRSSSRLKLRNIENGRCKKKYRKKKLMFFYLWAIRSMMWGMRPKVLTERKVTATNSVSTTNNFISVCLKNWFSPIKFYSSDGF